MAAFSIWLLAGPIFAERFIPNGPGEPPNGRTKLKLVPRPGGAISRQSVDEKSMRALIHQLVACGTRLSISSWTDPKRGVGCGRDQVAARLNEIAKDYGGRLQVAVDKFVASSHRTPRNPPPPQNVPATLPLSH